MHKVPKMVAHHHLGWVRKPSRIAPPRLQGQEPYPLLEWSISLVVLLSGIDGKKGQWLERQRLPHLSDGGVTSFGAVIFFFLFFFRLSTLVVRSNTYHQW